MELWASSTGPLSPEAPRYVPRDQHRRERIYDQAMHEVEREARTCPRNESDRTASQERMTASFGRFAATALDLEPNAIDLLTDDFLPVGTSLAQWARRFDPALSKPDIIQACRNAWTACGLQPLLGEEIRLNPAILGYSLLYPYTDNYLDDPHISSGAKHAFGNRFHDRLAGVELAPSNTHETSLWRLVRLIEDQYPRPLFPQVFESLLAIHRAQQESLAQLNDASACADDLLRLSCAKGGASVLADACLARGFLNPEETLFAFEWGVLLQLGDDLQDVREDLRRGSATLFTLAARSNQPLDSLARQLLHFSNLVATHMERLPSGSRMLKDLLKNSWHSLIIQAIADSQEFFTRNFLAEMEPRSPFRFGFLRSRRKRLTRRRGLYQTLFDRFLEAPESALETLPPPVRAEEPEEPALLFA